MAGCKKTSETSNSDQPTDAKAGQSQKEEIQLSKAPSTGFKIDCKSVDSSDKTEATAQAEILEGGQLGEFISTEAIGRGPRTHTKTNPAPPRETLGSVTAILPGLNEHCSEWLKYDSDPENQAVNTENKPYTIKFYVSLSICRNDFDQFVKNAQPGTFKAHLFSQISGSTGLPLEYEMACTVSKK